MSTTTAQQAPGTVTAAQIRTELVEPLMDAQAVNHEQAALLANFHTLEADSVAEVLIEVDRHMSRLVDLCNRIAASNGIELRLVRQPCGWADRVATDMRDAELNGADHRVLTKRKLAEVLKPLVEEYARAVRAGDPFGAGDAAADIYAVFRTTPADTLFHDAVTYHLGKVRTARLRELHARYVARKKDARS